MPSYFSLSYVKGTKPPLFSYISTRFLNRSVPALSRIKYEQAAYTFTRVIFMDQRKQLKRRTIAGIFFVLIAGTISHFLYEWTGKNPIAGLIFPINESVWEHMKLLFFPMLLYAPVFLFRERERRACALSAFCLGILIGTACIPVFFYAYTFFLGKSILAVDLLIFLLSAVIAFGITYRFTISCRMQNYTAFLCLMAGVLLVCFLVFTYRPPDLALFSTNPLAPGAS